MAWIEHLHERVEDLHQAAAQALLQATQQGLDTRGAAFLSLAGGSTPWPVYRQLARQPLRWADVSLLPGDERCVPHDHPACNLTRLREAFADAPDAHIVPLTTQDGDAALSQARAQAWLARHQQPFDAVLLGIGQDGHFASLFPGAAQLPQALDHDCPLDAMLVEPDPLPPEAPFARISLTLPRLLRTQSLLLLATGDAKREVLAQAQADPARHPVGALLHAPGAQVHIHWSP